MKVRDTSKALEIELSHILSQRNDDLSSYSTHHTYWDLISFAQCYDCIFVAHPRSRIDCS